MLVSFIMSPRMERLKDEFERNWGLSDSVKLLHLSCLSVCSLIYIHPITYSKFGGGKKRQKMCTEEHWEMPWMLMWKPYVSNNNLMEGCKGKWQWFPTLSNSKGYFLSLSTLYLEEIACLSFHFSLQKREIFKGIKPCLLFLKCRDIS